MEHANGRIPSTCFYLIISWGGTGTGHLLIQVGGYWIDLVRSIRHDRLYGRLAVFVLLSVTLSDTVVAIVAQM